MDASDLPIRPVTDEEFPAFMEAQCAAFGERYDREADLAHDRRVFELDRTLAAFDGDRIVAAAGIYTFDLTVPGPRQLTAAGVTAVGVLPTHRRRGLLTRLMARQLDEIAARGDPLAILTASEGGIYHRYGYGPATFYQRVELDPRRVVFARPSRAPGRMVMIEADEAPSYLPAVYDRVRRTTVGGLSRHDGWWADILRDPERLRAGRGRRFLAVHETAPGEADGYVTWRVEASWGPGGIPDGTLHVEELCATDDEVATALWQFLTNIDLVAAIRAVMPVDDPLPWRLADPRQVRTTSTGDHVWLRVVDVVTALAGRCYGADGRLVLAVDDPFRPAAGGTFVLEARDGQATAGRTDERPDLELGATELGSVYLGGVSFRALARAGRITEHTPGALVLADCMFATHPAPWTHSDF